MSSTARSLTEPEVLAHTKRRLFPDEDPERAYAVADTQFSREEWLPGRPVDPDVRERLSPFNHVRIGGGYPDLVGVRALESELLAVERFGDEPPLIAVEAKGHTSGGSIRISGSSRPTTGSTRRTRPTSPRPPRLFRRPTERSPES